MQTASVNTIHGSDIHTYSIHTYIHAYIHAYIHTNIIHTHIGCKITLGYITLHCLTVHYISGLCITIRSYKHTCNSCIIALHYTTLHYMTVLYSALHFVALHNVTLHACNDIWLGYITCTHICIPDITLHCMACIHTHLALNRGCRIPPQQSCLIFPTLLAASVRMNGYGATPPMLDSAGLLSDGVPQVLGTAETGGSWA